MTGGRWTIRLVPEYAIDDALREQTVDLLETCFPGAYEGRTFFKQLPHFRFCAFDGDVLVGQISVGHRVIRVDGTIVSIMGLEAVCVAPDHRRSGLGSELLATVERLAKTSGVLFLVLMADEHAFYLANGFRNVSPAVTKWLAIEDVEIHSVIERDMDYCFMIKELGPTPWPNGKIDMLGFLF